MSSAAASSVSARHSGVLATPVKSKDKFFDALDTIAHIALRSIGFLAVFYSSYYVGYYCAHCLKKHWIFSSVL
ncbi:MAG: hypothetical protein KR126chlam5_00675 [Candidatus Anoxychlamydiales bacterium]|nr:hypothetical protein [Candidatus Anoxychlamydiales bacterium]